MLTSSNSSSGTPFFFAGGRPTVTIFVSRSNSPRLPCQLTLPTCPIRPVGDHRFSGNEQASNRGGALQRQTHYLGRIDDPRVHHVDIGAGSRVKSVTGITLLQ